MTVRRVALVTAATSSIGRTIAEALAASGHIVYVSGRSVERGMAAVSEMSAQGEVHFLQAEALSQDDMEGLVDQIVQRHGRLDVVVNNAGGSGGFAPVHQLTDEAFDQAIRWNVSSTFWIARRAIPSMLEHGFGRIINISSVQGKQANRPNASHYVTAKHAVNGLTKAIAVEYGRQGITCNAICVGAVETDLMRTAGAASAKAVGLSYEEYRDGYASKTMIGRLNEPQEIAAMAALLASDAGGGITGAILNVDGGTCSY
ncbi:MAG TPA: SDR family NAD(P)-dependent oxidoreductase [Sphingopyxis sp.]|nr:SDR family NAD(P)-dependent oxidoreductase [Sphingopyxis sp.]